jgi:hypothetical protein
VLQEFLLSISQEAALVADPFVVNFEDVCRQSFSSGSLVLAHGASKRLDVGVHVAFQTPVVTA